MRIDREAFLLAVSALAAGCERADSSETRSPPFAPTAQTVAQRPASAVITREASPEQLAMPTPTPVPAPEPIADVKPTPAPKPKPAKARRPVSASKRWFLGLSMEQRSNVTSLCEERLVHPCAGMFAALAPRPAARASDSVDDDGELELVASKSAAPDNAEDRLLAGMSSQQQLQAAAYCQEQSGMPAPSCETPLVVAFDNQPIDFAAAGRERFAFVPGEPAATDWPTAATPWIALDLDGDGAITSGAELFGSSTLLAGNARARNGFQALAALDANGDGTLDARDPMFARLVLWSDRNGDHRSTPDELRPLASVVTAIPLAHTVDPRCNARDDCEGERGALRWRDADGTEHVGAVVDVYVSTR